VQQIDVTIRKATYEDVIAVKTIADANRESIGFVLRPALEEHASRGWLYVADYHDAVAGFVNFRHRRDGWTVVYEICVDAPARMQRIGYRLLSQLHTDVLLQKGNGIVLKCPEGSKANDFYDAIGWQRVGEEPGKQRKLIIWQWKRSKRYPLCTL
jgi:N-acetylglutamate synthase-like GNAT family acetyltransferase